MRGLFFKVSGVLFHAFIFFVCWVQAQPQSLPEKTVIFEQLPRELGLGQRTINCIIQGSEGYLWIGSWSGLVRYDGYETKIYSSTAEKEHALKSNKITSILEDKEGFLWVGTLVGGLFRFDKHTEQFEQFLHEPTNPKSLSNNNVWSIVQDSTGNIWVGTEDGLNFYDRNKGVFTSYANKEGLSDQFITDLYFDHGGHLWACTEYGANEIYHNSQGDIQIRQVLFEKDDDDDLHNYVYETGSLLRGGIEIHYFVTKKGLKKWDGREYTNYLFESKDTGYSFFRTMQLIEGDHPFILVGSEVGLNIFDLTSNEFTHSYGNSKKSIGLSHNTIMEIILDRTGVIWVGTKKGLNKFDTYDKNVVLYPINWYDKTGSGITGLDGKDNSVYVSSMGGGLYRYDKSTAKFHKYIFDLEQGSGFTDFVQRLLLDSQGRIWVGTAGTGVIMFDPLHPKNRDYHVKEYKHFARSVDGSLSDNYAMSLAEDEQGRIWVGTWNNGLNLINKDGSITTFTSPVYRHSPIVSLLAQRDILWVGTRGSGIYKIGVRGDSLKVLDQFSYKSDDPSLSNNFVMNIFERANGDLWIGTEEGLNYIALPDEKIRVYKKEQGLVSNEVNSILTDNDGRLWLANFEGLSTFKVNGHSLELVNHYDIEDRIQGGFFYDDVAYKDEQGHLYFGGSNGLNIIDPKTLKKNPFVPEVIINEMTVFNESLKPGKSINGRVVLDSSLNTISSINLKHFENSLKFKFSSMHFAAPAKNRYAYKLDGFDKGWKFTEPGSRMVNYTNIPEGKYTFMVKASNNDGVWNDNPQSLEITILPPWWKTSWALLIYAALAVGILYLFRRMVIIRTNFQNRLKMERLEIQNLEKLNKAKLEFFTNVSHEFRTPLTLIHDPLERIISSGEGGKYFKEQLSIVSVNTQRLLRLVNQLLDFRKVESHKVNLRAAEGNIVKFVKEIKLSFDGVATQRDIDFQLYATSNVVSIYFDRDQCEKIVFNLLSNAFKYVDDKGKVSIKILEKNKDIQIIVENTGKGIKQELIEKIFERFYSGEDQQAIGTGIGLALTKSLTELHHGNIFVENENGVTRFVVELPKGREHLKQEEAIDDFKDSEFIGNYEPLEDISTSDPISYNQSNKDVSEMDKILIVEDNQDVRSYLKSIFLGEYIILEAENGRMALEIAKEEVPNVIISDVMMPVMDGITFCKRIKSQRDTSHIPIILLTARTSLIFRLEGLEHGADDYITKPFNSRELILKVQNLIKSRKQLQKLFRDNDELVIEPKKVTLTSADELFIKQALESIENNIDNSEYSVDDFGRDVGLSRMQLYRKLKAMTGQSANEFIRTIRIKRAAQLIEQGQFTVAEVTYKVGFSDLQYFRSCFKKQFGVNPSQYGKNNQAEKSSENTDEGVSQPLNSD